MCATTSEFVHTLPDFADDVVNFIACVWEGFQKKRHISSVLISILDYLATGEPLKAADLVAQRMKALELASVDANNWEKATYLELLEPSHTTLINKDEEL